MFQMPVGPGRENRGGLFILVRYGLREGIHLHSTPAEDVTGSSGTAYYLPINVSSLLPVAFFGPVTPRPDNYCLGDWFGYLVNQKS